MTQTKIQTNIMNDIDLVLERFKQRLAKEVQTEIKKNIVDEVEAKITEFDAEFRKELQRASKNDESKTLAEKVDMMIKKNTENNNELATRLTFLQEQLSAPKTSTEDEKVWFELKVIRQSISDSENILAEKIRVVNTSVFAHGESLKDLEALA